MRKLYWLVRKARSSSMYLSILNGLLKQMVPFNKSHHLKIRDFTLEPDGFMSQIKVILPHTRSNLNHIKGIHACALATLCEYTSGILILFNISAADYRIILSNINVTYHYQAKTDVYATLSISKEWIEKEIVMALNEEEKIQRIIPVDVYDTAQNHICTGQITWQIKSWKNVKTKS